MKQESAPTIDLDSLIKDLEIYKEQGFQLSFSGLTYYRLKTRGDNLVQLEFNETVYLDSSNNVVKIRS